MKRSFLFKAFLGKTLVFLFSLWLIFMCFLTCCLAGDLLHQGSGVAAAALERSLIAAKENTKDASEQTFRLYLPDLEMVPDSPVPLLKTEKMTFWKASLTVNADGIVVFSDGFDTGNAGEANTGITVTDGKLAFVISQSLLDGSEAVSSYDGLLVPNKKYAGKPTEGYLTFRIAPQRKGSFPSAEFSDTFPVDADKYRASEYRGQENRTPMALLDGIDSGIYHFDASGILRSSRIRGSWLRDPEGNPAFFVLAAYGWSPLLNAAGQLVWVYILGLILFLLGGVILCLVFRRTLVFPLSELGDHLASEPLELSKREYDYAWEYAEMQKVEAGYLLRHQMLRAHMDFPEAKRKECSQAELTRIFDRAVDKLQPILIDRGQKIEHEYLADGNVCAGDAQVEEALLALIQEAVPYVVQNGRMILRVVRSAGFLLSEAEISTKHGLPAKIFHALWEGIYRSPENENAPGGKLRNCVSAMPGSFCAARRTAHGLSLTLGLPEGKGSAGSMDTGRH